MRRTVFILLVLMISILSAATIESTLTEAMQSASPGEKLRVMIHLNDKIDAAQLREALSTHDRSSRKSEAIDALRDFSQESQAGLVDFLDSRVTKVSNMKPIWIVNAVYAEMTKEIIEQVVLRTDVEWISLVRLQKKLIDPVVSRDGGGTRDLFWALDMINAPEVWAQNYTGQGVIVAVIDSGVNYNHADLANHMWIHPDYPYHGYDFIEDDPDPMDEYSHGTHVAGSIAGDGTSGTQTGVAPGAMIMALRIFDSSGQTDDLSEYEAYEFAIEHGADVVSCSYGWTGAPIEVRQQDREAMENLLAAGIIASISAGNKYHYIDNYPVPDNCGSPSICPPPWLHPDQTLTGGLSAVISTGAVDESMQIGYFSSTGPATWEDVSPWNDYPFDPEMGLIRPDLVAPGVDIVSCSYDDNSGYATKSGTSMAQPHTAGAIALLLSKNYNLTPAEICEALQMTALPLTPTKENRYGAGLLQIDQAIAYIDTAPAPAEPCQPNPTSGATDILPPASLSWLAQGGISHRIWLGTDTPPTNIIYAQETGSANYALPLNLDYDQTYYWQVESIGNESSTMSPIWNFSTCEPPSETFEDGLSQFPWSFGGDAAWTLSSERPMEGDWCLESGDIDYDQTTSLSVTVNCGSMGEMSFWMRYVTEENREFVTFSIDGVPRGIYTGEEGWERYDFTVFSGEHTFEWSYSQNGTYRSGREGIALDGIFFPDVSVPATAPSAAANPTPEDGESEAVLVTPATLQWENGDYATSYRLYLGTNIQHNNLLDGVTIEHNTFYRLPFSLDPETLYRWRIDSINDYGTTSGTMWDFTTAEAPDESFESGDFTNYYWSFTGVSNCRSILSRMTATSAQRPVRLKISMYIQY